MHFSFARSSGLPPLLTCFLELPTLIVFGSLLYGSFEQVSLLCARFVPFPARCSLFPPPRIPSPSRRVVKIASNTAPFWLANASFFVLFLVSRRSKRDCCCGRSNRLYLFHLSLGQVVGSLALKMYFCSLFPREKLGSPRFRYKPMLLEESLVSQERDRSTETITVRQLKNGTHVVTMRAEARQ